MAKKHPFFDEAALERIQAAVRQAEASTLGEIVPVVVDSSDAYPEAQDRAGIAALMLATLVVLILPVEIPLWEMALIQALAFVIGWFAGNWPPLARLLVGRSAMDAMVRWRAEVAFREHGLGRTTHGTGVLVFASLFEHEVVVLGDKPVHEKVGEGTWNEAVEVLVRRIREKRPADGFVEAIERVGVHLREHFPRAAGEKNPNELPDHLTVR
ncbi:TPM domain-containing protein [Vulgatibacter sp.]|uniref:TPM domain-containing protein n=1 Tax=Vulgatibacter sp. TaxID=1971226 RepID=UPI0035665F71